MLDNICKQQGEGEAAAMQILDVLRALRQQPNSRLRMVLTGSIGLHHVVSMLRQKGDPNSPINDMRRIEVGIEDRFIATYLEDAKRDSVRPMVEYQSVPRPRDDDCSRVPPPRSSPWL